jgi:hypothetical protein
LSRRPSQQELDNLLTGTDIYSFKYTYIQIHVYVFMYKRAYICEHIHI